MEIASPRRPYRFALALLAFSSLAFACGGGGASPSSPAPPPPPPPPPPASGALVVEVYDNTFSPASVSIQPGQTVTWTMMGTDRSHTVTDENGAFNSGFAFTQVGDTYQHTFTEADRDKTFEYRCNSHQGCCQMQGSVRVGDNAPPPKPGY